MALLKPDWPAPSQVSALSTTRDRGYSSAPFNQFNLATHVNDQLDSVKKNRQLLIEQANLPEPPRWLVQTHSNHVVHSNEHHEDIEADACFTNQVGHVCAIMTADCLPILVCNQQGTEVAAIHAGWRGLANNIIEQTINQFTTDRSELMIWLGPAIGPNMFEVGQDVYDAFTQRDSRAKSAFVITDKTHYLANIYQLARQQLTDLGINNIHGGDRCTVTEKDDFFSFRRDGKTGRMASVIWLN